MLRIGKNPTDQKENESQSQKQEPPDYSTPKTYPPYQNTPPQEVKPATESVTAAASSRAMTESETIARDIKEGTLSGFVGAGTLVTGEANFKAMMRVDGHLSGRVISSSGTLIVGANGKVDANIEVAVAIIHGTINGDIIATQRLELGRAAKVNGNIQTPSLVIEQGAVFEGSCKMQQMSAAKEKAVRKLPDEKLDTGSLKPLSADGSAAKQKPAEISVSGTVS
jgi:cytoskeletal protein CcmA (bactofilin family)